MKICALISNIYLTFKISYLQLLIYLPLLNFSAWLAVMVSEFIKDQLYEIQISFSTLNKIRDERYKLENLEASLKEKEDHLKKAEHFLAKQVEKHNNAKANLMQEVRDYHQELVNDFILRQHTNGSNN